MDVYPNQDNEVSISQQGTTTITQETVNPPSVGYNTHEFVVPAGKKWIVYATHHNSVSLVATVSEIITAIDQGIYSVSVDKGTDSTGKKVYVFPIPITLAAGDSLKMQTQLSAYTSGYLTYGIIYTEFDA